MECSLILFIAFVHFILLMTSASLQTITQMMPVDQKLINNNIYYLDCWLAHSVPIEPIMITVDHDLDASPGNGAFNII